MGAFTNKHPTDLTELVARAVANGATTAQVQRDLAAGTFAGWAGPYQMPLETIRYYGKKERQRRAAKTVTPEVRDNPKKVVDDLARLLLSKAQRGAVAVKDDDRKGLKEWGETLKVLDALVRDTVQTEAKPSKRDKRPTDPLTERLTSPSLPVAIERDEQKTETPRDDTPHGPTNWPNEGWQHPPTGGVLAQPSFIASS